MKIIDFVNEFKAKKVMNNRVNEHAVEDFIRENLEIKTYIPMMNKREIAEMIVDANTNYVNGVWKHDSIGAYISFVVAMLQTHTNFEFENPIEDYDTLAASGLLPVIIEMFRVDYNECEVVLKMAVAAKLEDNNVGVLIGNFLDNVLKKLELLGNKLEDMDLPEMINQLGIGDLLNKYKQ